MSAAQQLATGIGELALAVPEGIQRRLLAYLDLIVKWNRVHNLTAIRDLPTMVSAHLLDSLAVATHLSASSVLDIGSGAGLPGIPLALIWPETRMTLIDSNQKKATFLQQAKIELGLRNLTIVCDRIELWKTTERFDVVISRAFSDLVELINLASPFCNAGGVLAAMKGRRPSEELGRLPPTCRVRDVLELKVPGLNAERHLVLIDP